MENETVVFDPKPGFSLVKYGDVFTFNFNAEFAQRLRNILADYHKNHKLQGQPLYFLNELKSTMEFAEDNAMDVAEQFVLERFEHVYTVLCKREFAQQLNQIFTQFLLQKRVSTALFSFIKQLEGALFPKRFATEHSDEF